jgi:predicted nucleic-acid-binding Zn-ribbon protein
MSLTIRYPFSRIAIRNCPLCRISGGELKAQPEMVVRAGENDKELMPLTCNRCGYTILFDVEQAKSSPYTDSFTNERF